MEDGCLFWSEMEGLHCGGDEEANLTVAINIVGTVARVRRRGDRPPSRKNQNIYSWQMCGDKEFLSLQVKIWTGSRHLVFWLLGTLTGL